jgi:acetylornithine deacetylase/succinyl-diaminopimelate desuccinylase-like protein
MARLPATVSGLVGTLLRGATVQKVTAHATATDVVEVGNGWTQDPFGGDLIDGKNLRIVVRDMAGGLAASIIAG